jgi:hypothetical protein
MKRCRNELRMVDIGAPFTVCRSYRTDTSTWVDEYLEHTQESLTLIVWDDIWASVFLEAPR